VDSAETAPLAGAEYVALEVLETVGLVDPLTVALTVTVAEEEAVGEPVAIADTDGLRAVVDVAAALSDSVDKLLAVPEGDTVIEALGLPLLVEGS
jgi:hypothetical protein